MPHTVLATAPGLILLLVGNVLLLTGRASVIVAGAVIVVGALGGCLRVGMRTFPVRGSVPEYHSRYGEQVSVGIVSPFLGVPSRYAGGMDSAIPSRTLLSSRWKRIREQTPVLARTLLLAASVVVYPFFVGGSVVPWLASVATVTLVVAGWVAGPEFHHRVVELQVLATALAGGLAIAAVLFFFPAAWQWSVVAALVGFGVLAGAIRVSGTEGLPISIAIAAVVLAEAVAVLRAFPSHWVVNGVVLALAFAAIIERERFPRAAYASLLVFLIAVGVF